ncbi:MAG: NAD-dependent epimerase/dehydratase family protein, partial [Candidatus Cloacimonadaceae bacterium]|nr:NAD-dependent epimerase/dehydratase family protein [Candidatus Cloacimonadaceae bacterium]
MQHILITGITGFIGKAVLEKIIDNKNYVIHAIVRPGTNPSRYQNFGKSIQIEEIDLSDSMGLAAYLAKHEFDYIIHIGAIRGGRRFSKLHYFQSNVVSVEVMADYCTRHGARL